MKPGRERGRRTRHTVASVVVLVLAVSGLVAVLPSPAATEVVTTTLTPVADTYVDASTPETSYGTNARLVADASPVREMLLRFDLSALSGPVQSARLRLHVANVTDSQSPNGGSVARVTNTTWSEASTTYGNRPTTWGTNVVGLGAVSRNSWVEAPVTSAVVTGGLLTLGVRSTNGDGAYYDSRHTGVNAPQLIVTSGTATTTTSSSTTTSSTTTTTSTSTTSSTSTSTTTSTTTTAPPTSGTTTLRPVADTYVDDATPTTSYGSNSRLITDASPRREVLLRFDLSALSGPVQTARLRLHVANATDAESPNGGNVARVDNTTWPEASTTFGNRPTTWGTNVAGLGAVSRNSWVEVPVTSAVTTGGLLTLGVRSTNGDGAYYDSRETGANAPQLVVTTGTPAPSMNAVEAACTSQLVATNAGTLTDTAIAEPSGIEVGVRNPGISWIHNDSGDSARVFAVDGSGVTQRRYSLSGAGAVDWEDIGIGAGPVAGTPYLYVADIGDNAVTRSEIVVYRVAEPAVVAGSSTTALTGVDALRLRYPDGAHNAESLLVDPATGALVIVAKTSNGGPAGVYAAPAGLVGGSTTTLSLVASLSLPTGSTQLVTGGDVSADGTQVALRTYAGVLLWPRDPANPVWSVFAAARCNGPVPPENKGEAIAFGADGRGYVTLNESTSSTLRLYRAP